ncbi:hypothetical protein V4E86_31705 [Burkholderia pseudomallei]|nr:hypothetical protein [Burkholderia pseudomallei]AYE32407.1 hypothetical protein CNX72_36260 [Burkholderia pseudomallei]EDS83377.1 hypothetical protein BURPSS13_X0892 [Burkholderia pseudomallei S13]MBD2918851.1 hypothetical protein [Burkholderia pseudomallei]MBD2998188.1 hypothetical protein [Burkholderia pseudomallei]MCD4520913.1 hypothetical protein [Burkholderia pseudomallei]
MRISIRKSDVLTPRRSPMRENTTPPNGRATQPGANAGNAVNGRECRGRRGEWRVASGGASRGKHGSPNASAAARSAADDEVVPCHRVAVAEATTTFLKLRLARGGAIEEF